MFCYVDTNEVTLVHARDVGRIQKVGAYIVRGTLITKNWQLLKLQRDTLPNKLWKMGGGARA